MVSDKIGSLSSMGGFPFDRRKGSASPVVRKGSPQKEKSRALPGFRLVAIEPELRYRALSLTFFLTVTILLAIRQCNLPIFSYSAGDLHFTFFRLGRLFFRYHDFEDAVLEIGLDIFLLHVFG